MDAIASDYLAKLLPAGCRQVGELARVPMRLTVLAEHDESGERAVVVVPAPDLVAHIEQRDRLRRHADAVAAMNHPHILPLRVLDGAATHLVTAVPADVELAALIPGASPPAGFLPVLAGIADALDAARRVGCYHGDLRAEDVLIDLRTGHACLSGFGVSPAAESAEDGAALDIEELGSLLVQCINGMPPTGAPVPPGLDEVLDRAMAEDPARLYPSCRALIDAAAAILLPSARAAGPAPRPVHVPRDPQRAGRIRLIVGSVLTVILLLVTAVTVGPWALAHWTPRSTELARVPAAVRVDCDLADPTGPVPNAARQLRCKDLAGQELISGLYDSAQEAEAGYQTAAAATPGARKGDGDCAASSGWEHVYPGVGAAAGRVLCVRDNSGARMIWLDRANRTVSTATRPDGNATTLYQVWSRWMAIPAFPAPQEQKLAGQLYQQNCRRAPAGSLDRWTGATAALDCTQPRDATTSVRYLHFADRAALNHAYQVTLEEQDVLSGQYCGETSTPGDDALTFASVVYGRIACSADTHSAAVIWTADPLLQMGIAVGPDRAKLMDWFTGNARPKVESLVNALNQQSSPPFPNTDEAALISRLPMKPEVQGCVRPSAEQINAHVPGAQVTAVVCWTPDSPGPIYFYRFADRRQFIDVTGTGGGPDCTANVSRFLGSARYSRPGGVTGILSCGSLDGRTSALLWSDDRTATLAMLMLDTSPANHTKLIAWWKANVN